MPENTDSADYLNVKAFHPVAPDAEPISPEQAANIEREAGYNIAVAGGTLPDGATDAAHEGYNSVPEEDRGKPLPEAEAAATDLGHGEAQAETIQGGDIHENVPAGMTNPPAPGPVVAHRPLTKDNLRDHAAAVAKAVYHLERDLAALGAVGTDQPIDAPDFDDLPDSEKEARTQQAALYVGNAVLGQPDTEDFRTLALWAIARSLRTKLVLRHRGVTPEV